MKRISKYMFIFFFIAVAATADSSVFAHPGSLDENGGHYVRSGPMAGTYHYHTGANTSSSSYRNPDYKYTPDTPYTPKELRPSAKPYTASSAPKTTVIIQTASPAPYAPEAAARSTVVPSAEPEKPEQYSYIYSIALSFGILFIAAAVKLLQYIRKKRKKKSDKNKISLSPNSSQKKELPKPSFICGTYGIPIKEKSALPSIPDDTEIGSDGLPRLKNAVPGYGWGRKYNAFITSSGTHYHRSRCKDIKKKEKQVIHIYTAIEKYTPCSKCNPKRKIDDWYLTYKQYMKSLESTDSKK